MPTLSDITSDFAVLDDWEDRYRYLIELGRELPPLPDELRTDANKVRGCASQVWLATDIRSEDGGNPVLHFLADSDAHIVRGLIAVLSAIYNNRPVEEVLTIEADPIFEKLGLKEHLTPQRSNGLASMVARVRADATTSTQETAAS